MGGSSSKPILPPILGVVPTKGTYTGDYVNQLASSNAAAQQAAYKVAQSAYSTASSWKTVVYSLVGITIAILLAITIYDIVARIKGWKTIMWPGSVQVSDPTPPNVSTISVGSGSAPYSSTQSDSSYATLGITGPTGPTGPGGSNLTGTLPPPPLLWEWWYGSGSMAGAVDGTGTTVVPAMNAPLSAGNQGAYGMQWWMYIKDWNYGYGKEKPIIVRPDTTNSAIMNPRVVLHPTDNSLRISVSIFPSDENGAVAEPAAAGHPATDDVFICEVPNIPLQSWFSVSLTVFERNLDVYLNGMLVKSCFMSGVPKPAVGDIQVTPEGGFSGMVCGLTTSNKMLNPSDALAFYSSDNSCHTISDKPSAAINTTGYSVKFGVYDTVGRQVREYTF